MPCSDHAVLLKAAEQHDRRETAVLCCGLEKNAMVGAWHGNGMASVNQTRPHCVNKMGNKHSKLLAARHGHGKATAWTQHAMCESAFTALSAIHTHYDAFQLETDISHCLIKHAQEPDFNRNTVTSLVIIIINSNH